MAASSLGRRRPRPVADAPALDGAELAKAWLVELVAIAPLDRAASVPGPRFADEAPRLCAAVAAALFSDAALDDLEPAGGLAPVAAGAGDLAGARDALEAVTALEALRSVMWAALTDELRAARPATVTDLADRLGAIVATLTAATIEAGGIAYGPRPGDRGPLAAVLRSEPPEAAPEEPPSPRDEEPSPAPRDEPPASADPAARLAWLGADRLDVAAAAAAAEAFAAGAGPEARRAADAPTRIEDASTFSSRRAPWTAAIERRLERHRQDGLPFGVLCVELVDLDRLVAADRDGEVAETLELAEAAMCSQLRPADALVRERAGRYWLTTPDTDAEEARGLAHRIVAAIAAAPHHRGEPLQAAVGLAICPTDALDAGELEARAEEGVFSARAAGIRVATPARD